MKKIVNNSIFKDSMPYIKLMRLDKPSGTLLLMLPALWSLFLASHKIPDPLLIFVFVIGSVLMRSAGCILNDIIDHKIDKEVERTKTRPIAIGEISVEKAIILLSVILLLAFTLLLTLNKLTILIGCFAVIAVALYPFSKRYFRYPQFVLGFVFNIGVLMAFSSVSNKIPLNAILIYIGSVFWTIGYDTIYAAQDKEDDIKIGIHSTAISFGENTQKWVEFFYKTAALSLICGIFLSRIKANGYLPILLPFLHLYWQIDSLNLNDIEDCRKKFNSNVIFGLLLFVMIIFAVY